MTEPVISPDRCFGCWPKVTTEGLTRMAMVEEPDREAFRLCAACVARAPYNDGALVVMDA